MHKIVWREELISACLTSASARLLHDRPSGATNPLVLRKSLLMYNVCKAAIACGPQRQFASCCKTPPSTINEYRLFCATTLAAARECVTIVSGILGKFRTISSAVLPLSIPTTSPSSIKRSTASFPIARFSARCSCVRISKSGSIRLDALKRAPPCVTSAICFSCSICKSRRMVICDTFSNWLISTTEQ